MFALLHASSAYAELRLALTEDLTTLDPLQIVDVPGAEVAAKIHAGLVRFTPDGQIVPDLAERWTVSDDGLRYTFHLRADAQFHTGRKVQASDVVASLERLATPASGSRRAWLLDNVVGVDAYREGAAHEVSGISTPDVVTVRLELREPLSVFLSFLAMPNAAVVDYQSEDDSPSRGAGPFALTEWQRGERVVLTRNDAYHGNAAAIDRIVYQIVPEAFSRMALFERGELDIIEVPQLEVGRVRSDPALAAQLDQVSGLNTYYLGINCQSDIGRDREFRQALNQAINREQMIRVHLNGLATPAKGPVPNSLPGGEHVSQPWAYDSDAARQQLPEQYQTGRSLKLYVRASKEAVSIAETLQAYLAQIGLPVQIEQRSWSALKTAIVNGEADLFFMSWYADYPHAENFLAPVFHSDNWGAGGNRAQYANRDVDNAIRTLQRSSDVAEQSRLIAAITDQVVADAPWVFLWHADRLYLHQAWVEGFTPSAIANGDSMLTVSSRRSATLASGGSSNLLTVPVLLGAVCIGLVFVGIARAPGYTVRRLVLAVPTLLGVALITFALLHALPDDPVLGLVGQQADEATIAQLREDMGLDDSMPVQFLRYVSMLVQGELGQSYYTGVSVSQTLAEKLPNTIRLAVAAMGVSILVGSVLGLGAALSRGKWGDVFCSSTALFGLSVPTFWLGLVLVYLFAYRWKVFPVAGMGRGELIYLVLPAVTLGTQSAAFVARLTRTALLEVFSQPFLTAVRAKGVAEWRVVIVHAYRNALLPLVTLFGVDLGSYVNGAVLTETIFGWDGVGRLAMTGVLQRDYPVVLGCVLFGAVVFVLVNVLVDVSYSMLDPRVRLQMKKAS